MTATRNSSANRSGGFTLIELLVVVAILGILATLIISVGSYVRTRQLEDTTKNTLRIIQLSVNVYKETKGSYPTANPAVTQTTDTDRENRSKFLYTTLTSVSKAREALSNLPQESMAGGEFADAFGKFIDYDPAGGAGGTPVLISAGQDGAFTTADDIRSDHR